MLPSLFMSITGPFRPSALADTRAHQLSAGLALFGLALTSAASGALMLPFARAAVRNAAMDPAGTLANTAIVVNLVILGPIGACVGALILGTLLWTFPMFAGHSTEWRRCVLVAAAAVGIEPLRRLFIVSMLWMREGLGRSEPDYVVRTGLDAFLVAATEVPDSVVAIASHVGPFEAWALVVATVALAAVERMPRRTAAATAMGAFAVVQGVQIALELSR